VLELLVFDRTIVAGMVGEEVEDVRGRSSPGPLADTGLTGCPVSIVRLGSV
jgi:hypothetical protein